MLNADEIETWLQQARDSGTTIDCSVSCPKCWRPMVIDGDGVAMEDGCRCGTVATLAEVKRAFGLEETSGSLHDIHTRD
ncbi:hypothetical protein LCGC14_2994570 [marine sediment metagenome]|uniref:Uncharacterized protein n=1 Tax=marine sediment metagenome TaxID=412755 RepID=A0A0F8ZAE4_9ZZZZ